MRFRPSYLIALLSTAALLGASPAHAQSRVPSGRAGKVVAQGSAVSDAGCLSGSSVADDNIVWGTLIGGTPGCNVDALDSDDNIVWGTLIVPDDNIIWGTAVADDNIVWGTRAADNIIWGTLTDGDAGAVDGVDNIIWGTLVTSDDNIVWGTRSAIH